MNREIQKESVWKKLVCPSLTMAFNKKTKCLGKGCAMWKAQHRSTEGDPQGSCTI